MKQAVSKTKTKHKRVPISVIQAARDGDVDAMTLIQQFYDPYIRQLAMVTVRGSSYLNVDLYDRLKTRLTMMTMKFNL
jgi:hypothetical protein